MAVKYDAILGKLREKDGGSTGQSLGGITTGSTLAVADGCFYEQTITENTSLTLTIGNQVGTIELRFKCTTGLPSIAFTNTILWGDTTGVYRSSNPAPSMSAMNYVYCIVIRYDGERYLGHLAYTVEM